MEVVAPMEVVAGGAPADTLAVQAEQVAVAAMAALAVWDLERSAPLAVLVVEEAATVPCLMLDPDRAGTWRRQTTSTSGLEAISMLSDLGAISPASSRLAAS